MKLHSSFKEIPDCLSLKKALTFYEADSSFIEMDYKTLKAQAKEVYGALLPFYNELPMTVGIYCDPGPAVIVCMLAILECNCSFIYISPDLTKPELYNLIKKVSPYTLLISEKYSEKLRNMFQTVMGSRLCIVGLSFLLINFNNYKNRSILVNYKYYDSIAYVMTTSGSTGVSKLVYVPHECIVPNVNDFIKLFNITKNDTILILSPLTFDPCIIDIFTSLSCGAHLIMLTSEITRQPTRLQYILKNNHISILQATPTILETLNADFLKTDFLSVNNKLRVLALGGEAFPTPSNLRKWIHPQCKTEIFNLYGITEVSCWASCQSINLVEYLSANDLLNDNENECRYFGPPLGASLTGTKLHLTDDFGNICTEGRGHIVISGERAICMITEGNSNNANVLSVNDDLISTGDIGFKKGKNIFYVERSDNIVKRNAHKIGLLEIEIAMKLHPDIRQCCAIVCKKEIILYVTLKENAVVNNHHLQKHLQTNLVSWKIPNDIIIKEELPISKNGKIHRQKLKTEREMVCKNLISSNFYSSFSADYMLEMWKEFLYGYYPQQSDNFISSGGTSIQAIQLAEKINDKIGKNIPELLDTLLNKSYMEVNKLVFNKKYKFDITVETSNIFEHGKSCEKNDKRWGMRKLESANQSIKLNLNKNEIIVVSKSGYHCSDKTHFLRVRNFLNLSVIWKVCLEKCIDSSPLIVTSNYQTGLYIGSHSHKFVGIDVKNGKEFWSINLSDRIEASASISQDGKSIYVGCYDGCLYSLNINNGKVFWKFSTGGIIKCTPVVHKGTGYTVFGSYDKNLYCIDSNGTLMWKKCVANGSIYSSPTIYKDNVYSATLDGYLACINIINGKIVWKEFIGKPIFSSLVTFSKGILFGSTDNNIYCYGYNGSYNWKFNTNGPVFSSPFIIENESVTVIAIGSHDHQVYFLDQSGIELASIKLSSPIFSTPFLVMKRKNEICAIINETVGEMHIIKLTKVNNLWQIEKVYFSKFKGELFSTPVLYNKMIFVSCRDDFVYSIKID